MTITRQRGIMREPSLRTFRRFTAVDKEITRMMFSHFCFHYLNGILGHFSSLFACFFLSLPEIQRKFVNLVFVWNMIGKIFSVTLSLFRYFFSISRLQSTILISNIQLQTCCYPFEKKYSNNNSKTAVQQKKKKNQSPSSKCMNYACCSCIRIHC